MHGDLERREKELKTLSDNLTQDPTNIELANRYWTAIGSAQCGGAVRDAYREVALASSMGGAVFARAYRELFLSSGESPRLVHFDETLVEALRTYLPQVTGEDHSNLEWVLRSIGRF